MYDVLLAVDESEERARAQTRAVSELPAAPSSLRATVLYVFTADNPEGASAHQIAAVRRARENLEESGIDVTIRETSGDPATAILTEAAECDVDLVTVAGSRRTPAGKVVFGSVAQTVLLEGSRPVLFCTATD